MNTLAQTNSIADLLVGNEKDESEELPAVEDEDLEDGSTQSEESEEPNNEEGETEDESSEETSEEISEEEEATWASALGIDDTKVVVDDEGKFAGVNVKVDGKVETVSVNDLIAGFQSNKSNTNKSKALAAERKELEALKVNVAQSYTKKLDGVENLTKHLEGRLVSEFQNVDWQQLRTSNPAEYAAMVQDFQLRSKEIEEIKQSVGQEKETASKEELEIQEKAFGEYLQFQAAKVLENNPDWAKPEVAKKALSGIKSFMADVYGFDDEEFSAIQDARIIEVLKDAMAYRNGKKVAEKKLAKPLPKVLKTTSRKPTQVSKVDQLTAKANKTVNVVEKKRLQNDAIAQLLVGG